LLYNILARVQHLISMRIHRKRTHTRTFRLQKYYKKMTYANVCHFFCENGTNCTFFMKKCYFFFLLLADFAVVAAGCSGAGAGATASCGAGLPS